MACRRSPGQRQAAACRARGAGVGGELHKRPRRFWAAAHSSAICGHDRTGAAGTFSSEAGAWNDCTIDTAKTCRGWSGERQSSVSCQASMSAAGADLVQAARGERPAAAPEAASGALGWPRTAGEGGQGWHLHGGSRLQLFAVSHRRGVSSYTSPSYADLRNRKPKVQLSLFACCPP